MFTIFLVIVPIASAKTRRNYLADFLFQNNNNNEMFGNSYEETFYALEIIDYFNISHFFTKIFGLNDHYAAGKIENAKLLIKDLDCKPNQILVLGDMTHDYDVANTIDADCILIPGGHQDYENLRSCGATIFDSISELFD